jgi:hypothetical protein
MKNRLERVESLLSASVPDAINDHSENQHLPATGEEGLSLFLTDEKGCSSFIGNCGTSNGRGPFAYNF